MKWFTLLLLLGSGAASAACPDYFNVEMRELNNTQRHNLCQLTEGKVVLVVNTASYCGYSGQFRDLEALYQSYKDKGLMVLGSPPTTSGRRRAMRTRPPRCAAGITV